VNRGLAEFSDTALPATSFGFALADRVDGGTYAPDRAASRASSRSGVVRSDTDIGNSADYKRRLGRR